ncbi:hypothetical protein C470_04966 [Halorubrum distributum JCM 13561]|uniref:AMP-dependent synthetase and ligase n=2 Tax=Halorubrum distributum TaxID=29283 RepID=M0NW47_9EURY|nr:MULTISPECIES: hypothetical protein [Halorubrum distributum group]ELZ28257.1 hypothetical protein C473_15316 [Halorubrum terrestre JCM 10247]EMA62016.1 hypothetical protein C470_04966 [Halorubrum litoreum JCM 13561]
MELVGDLLARDRRTRDTALVTADGRERSHHDLITNGYKAANVLRYLGVRAGATVAVDPTPGFHTTLAFLGAAAVGAPVRFDPAAGIEAGDRVVLAPVATAADLDPAPGTNLAAFGGSPERPETTHWEQELWSENPGTPPSDVEPDDAAIVGPEREFSHRELCSLAAAAVEASGIDAETRVVLRRPFSDSPAVAAGLVAPLSVGGTAVLAAPTGDGEESDGEPRGDVAVAPADADVPEPRRIDPASIASTAE